MTNISISNGLSTEQFRALMRKLDKIESKVERNFNLEVIMANALDDVEVKLTTETDAGDAMMTLLGTIKASLDAAGVDQTRLAALSAKLGDKAAAWTAATLANTPAAEQAPDPNAPPVVVTA